MEAEAQASLGACLLDTQAPARSLQASPLVRPCIRQIRQASAAPVLLLHHQATWPRLLRLITLRRRRATVLPHLRRTRLPHPLAIRPRLRSTLLRRRTTALLRPPLWELHHLHTAQHRHSTALRHHSTVPRARSIRQAMTGALLLLRHRRNTALRARDTRRLAQLGTSRQPRRDTLLPLRARRTRNGRRRARAIRLPLPNSKRTTDTFVYNVELVIQPFSLPALSLKVCSNPTQPPHGRSRTAGKG